MRPLRDYQKDCIEYTLSSLSPSGYFTKPTGTGKTRTITGLIERLQGRILVLAHRRELIQQMAQAITDDTGETPGIVMADTKQVMSRVIVGTIQTLKDTVLAAILMFGDIDTILIDECHHGVLGSRYQMIIDYVRAENPKARVIGCTATPYRADSSAMQELLPVCFFERSIPDMQRAGWLAPVTWQQIEIPLDLSKVRTSVSGGDKDFNAQDLEILIHPHTHLIVKEVVDFLKWESIAKRDRPTVVFCCSVEHAKEVAECFTRYGIKAAAVWSEMPREDREYTLDAWKKMQIQVVCNVGMLTEGFDYTPAGNNKNGLGCVCVFRPTKSPALYLQMIGRGTRLKPVAGDFKDCFVFDVGNANLLDTKQITLPRIIPSFQEPEPGSKSIKLGYEEEEAVKGEKKRSTFTLRVNDPLAESWASWGFHSGSGTYYTNLSISGVYAFMYRRKNGLYNGGILTKQDNDEWTCQWITDQPKTLVEMMKHMNHVFSQNGYKRYVEKNAKWRKDLATEKQVNIVRRIAPSEYKPYLTKEQAGHILSWFVIRGPLISHLKELRAHVEQSGRADVSESHTGVSSYVQA